MGLVEGQLSYDVKLGGGDGYIAVWVVGRAGDEAGIWADIVRFHGGEYVRGSR